VDTKSQEKILIHIKHGLKQNIIQVWL